MEQQQQQKQHEKQHEKQPSGRNGRGNGDATERRQKEEAAAEGAVRVERKKARAKAETNKSNGAPLVVAIVCHLLLHVTALVYLPPPDPTSLILTIALPPLPATTCSLTPTIALAPSIYHCLAH